MVKRKKKEKLWRSRNVMFFKGKKISKPFIDFTKLKAPNRMKAEKMIEKSNKEWNRLQAKRKSRYRVKVHSIKKV